MASGWWQTAHAGTPDEISSVEWETTALLARPLPGSRATEIVSAVRTGPSSAWSVRAPRLRIDRRRPAQTAIELQWAGQTQLVPPRICLARGETLALALSEPRHRRRETPVWQIWPCGPAFNQRMLRLRLNGSPPCLCSEGELGHDVLSAVYVYPELTQFEGGGTDAAGDRDWNDDAGITRRSIDIRVQLCVTPRELIVALDLANRSRRRVRLDAAWQLSADFADLQEALSGKREQTAEVDTACEPGELVFRYAHPRLPLWTRVRAEGAVWRSATDGFTLSIELAPGEPHSSRLIVRPEDDGATDDNEATRARIPSRRGTRVACSSCCKAYSASSRSRCYTRCSSIPCCRHGCRT